MTAPTPAEFCFITIIDPEGRRLRLRTLGHEGPCVSLEQHQRTVDDLASAENRLEVESHIREELEAKLREADGTVERLTQELQDARIAEAAAGMERDSAVNHNALVWDRVKKAEADRDAAREEARRLGRQAAAMREALALDSPFPVYEVLLILADAEEHLRNDHDCDATGHERRLDAQRTARQIASALANLATRAERRGR